MLQRIGKAQRQDPGIEQPRGSGGTVGKQTLTQGLDGGDVHAAAQRGVSGSGGPLPFLDLVQRSFGRHDVRGIKAHVGGQAAEGAGEIRAKAYAMGDQIAFAAPPDLRTVAHEAAHVIQQRGSVQLAGGVGQAGDAHERHADAVAELVVAGQSAESLLDTYGGGAPIASGGTATAVQRIITENDLPIIDKQNTALREDKIEASSKVVGTFVYEQGGKPGTIELPVYDNSFASPIGTYTKYAHGIDKKKGHDAEPKLLDFLELKIEHLEEYGAITKATLHLRGTRGPCYRCQGVIQVFQNKFKYVEVKSYYEQARKVEPSNIINEKTEKNYKNGYHEAVPATKEFVPMGRPRELEGLWYRNLRSLNDIENNIDPKQEYWEAERKKQALERRNQFHTAVSERREAIFKKQTSQLAIHQTHRLSSNKVRGKSETVNAYKERVGTPAAPDLTSIHPDLTLGWRLSNSPGKGSSASITAEVTYPRPAVFDKTHDDVDTLLTSEGVVPGFTHKGKDTPDPDLAASGRTFDARFDAFLQEVLDGTHDDRLRSYDKFDHSLVPPLVT